QGPNNLIVYWDGDSGRMGWGIDDQDGGWHAITTDLDFPQGRWVHVAATVDAQGNGALYWDGQVVASGPLAVPPAAARGHPFPARSSWYWDSAFTGSLAEVKIWSGARTPDQIRDDMTAVPGGDEPDLEAYYRFDEGTGTTAHDHSPLHRD